MIKTKKDLHVFESLSILTIEGFETEKETATDPKTGEVFNMTAYIVDLPGDANWFCDNFGMASDPTEEGGPGILWSDYDGGGWEFAVLVDSDEVELLKQTAENSGYSVLSVEEINEPQNFGDGNGTVEIIKHRDGWIVLT